MSHLAFSRMALRIVATLAAVTVLGACGYKGPLFFPGEKSSSSGNTSSSGTPANAVPADPQLP